jgi:hypothetical protein
MKILCLMLHMLLLSSCGHLINKDDGDIKELGMRIETLALMTNPKDSLVHDIIYRQFDWHSGPSVIVIFDSVKEAKDVLFELPLSNGNKLHDTIDLRVGQNVLRFDELVQESDLLGVLVTYIAGEAVEIALPKSLSQFEVSGVVNDLDGSPVEGAWVVVLDPIFYNIATTDKLGRYTMLLPAGEYDSIAAFDSRYPKDRLEDYYWNFTADQSKTIDFRLGTIEAFRLTVGVSRQNKILSGTFIAYSTDKINQFLEREKPTDMNHPGFFLMENTPDLNAEDLHFYLDGCKLEGPVLLERADILIPNGQVGKNLGYRFEVSYRGCAIQNDYTELELKLKKDEMNGGARLGSLRFL